MQPLHTDELYIVEGVVTRIVPWEGVLEFQVEDQWFRVTSARLDGMLAAGDRVRMLVQDRTAQSILDVLVLERRDEGKLEYTGAGASFMLTVVAAALLAFAFDEANLWLLVPACALALLQVKFSLQKDRIIRRYKTLREQLRTAGSALAGVSGSAGIRELEHPRRKR